MFRENRDIKKAAKILRATWVKPQVTRFTARDAGPNPGNGSELNTFS